MFQFRPGFWFEFEFWWCSLKIDAAKPGLEWNVHRIEFGVAKVDIDAHCAALQCAPLNSCKFNTSDS